MSKFKDIFGHQVAGTRVIPVTVKIVLVFTLIILVSNLSSNYINLIFNRAELVSLMRQLLIRELRDINSFSNNQHEIFKFNQDRKGSLEAIEKKSGIDLKNQMALALGVDTQGNIVFQASKFKKRFSKLDDKKALQKIKASVQLKGRGEGFLNKLVLDGKTYFAVFKYNERWDLFIIRAEEENDFYRRQREIFRNVSIIIFIITLASALVGIILLRQILRFIGVITAAIMKMIEEQKLEKIDLDKAVNDDITYLGMAFNSLSNTIDNLVSIFSKFTNRDVVKKAYRDREVRLEGDLEDLTIFFSDIKSFTYITETLGMDIIKLLNIHYDRAVHEIQDQGGIVTAIIGDALLAIFGVAEDGGMMINKSYHSVLAAYKVQEAARELRKAMHEKKKEIETGRGQLSPQERKVFRAVLLEVGVGIDGGPVFYGTIGSYARMTNTVIGDNVNSSARLEGLTRIYRAPVIISEYIKNDIEDNVPGSGLHFIELDTVQVKGKTTGKKIYMPVPEEKYDEKVKTNVAYYREGLRLYYAGDWPAAYKQFRHCKFKFARVFRERTRGKSAPEGWNGIWEMTEK